MGRRNGSLPHSKRGGQDAPCPQVLQTAAGPHQAVSVGPVQDEHGQDDTRLPLACRRRRSRSALKRKQVVWRPAHGRGIGSKCKLNAITNTPPSLPMLSCKMCPRLFIRWSATQYWAGRICSCCSASNTSHSGCFFTLHWRCTSSSCANREGQGALCSAQASCACMPGDWHAGTHHRVRQQPRQQTWMRWGVAAGSAASRSSRPKRSSSTHSCRRAGRRQAGTYSSARGGEAGVGGW